MLDQNLDREDFIAFVQRKLAEANVTAKQAEALLSVVRMLEVKDLEEFLIIMQHKKRDQARELADFFLEIRERYAAEEKEIEALLAVVQTFPRSFEWPEVVDKLHFVHMPELPHFDLTEVELKNSMQIVDQYLDALEQDPTKKEALTQLAEKCRMLKAEHAAYQETEAPAVTVAAPASMQAALPAHIKEKREEIRQELAVMKKQDRAFEHFLHALSHLSHFTQIQVKHPHQPEHPMAQRFKQRTNAFSDLFGFLDYPPHFSLPYSQNSLYGLPPSKVIAPVFERHL